MGIYDEIGTTGLQEWAGYIREAYNTKLDWPGCVDEYNRIWRGDPEMGVARNVLQAFASRVRLEFIMPEKDGEPSDDDKAAVEFGNQVLDDLEGGPSDWLTSCLSRVPFYGWGWWECPLGVRDPSWRPPHGDNWRSGYSDGLTGYRRLAFRHYKSFDSWDTDDRGRVRGMNQNDYSHGKKLVTIPLDRSLHIRFGDLDNPEGLATLEAIWRLERVKYGLEIVLGIGAEHTAGYLNVTAEKALGPEDQAAIKKAARAIMTAQEGNYAAWPEKIKGELIDVPFAGGQIVLDAIRYFGILKLALLNMQWMALGTLSPYGSYSSMSDASQMFVQWFNAITAGIVTQADQQIGRRLFELPANKAAFPGMTRRPVLHATPIQKDTPLAEMAQFITALNAIMPLGDDDLIAVRRKAEFLPDKLPDMDERSAEPELPEESDGVPGAELPEMDDDDIELPGEMAQRPFVVGDDEQPTDTEYMADDVFERVDAAVRRFKTWAAENEPGLAGLLDAKPVVDDEQG